MQAARQSSGLTSEQSFEQPPKLSSRHSSMDRNSSAQTEQQSALEAWSQIAPSIRQSDPVATYLPLILSAAGALGVAPFALMRWLTGDWVIAVIDTMIVVGFVCLGTFVYRTRNVRVASIAIAVLSVSGTVITVYVRGPQQALWAYPALMAVFYLMKPREAILMTVAMLAVIVPPLLEQLEAFRVATILITALVTTVFAYAFSVINNRQQRQLVDLATKDPLTGAGNRRALETRLTELVAAFERNGKPASLLLLDLDHVKAVNDIHGHATGDQILQRITQIVELRIRTSDSLYRIGGEEFVVVVDGQNVENANHLAEQLRTLVDANELVPESNVTISVGVAEIRRGETYAKWLHRADNALYQAKRAGRNTVRCAT